MFVMFTDELLLAFETICSTLTGLWCGHEKLGYHALLILLECCTINICAADISWKVILLQLKGYTRTEWLRFSPTTSYPFIMYPFLESLAFSLTPESDIHVLPPTRTYRKTLVFSTVTPMQTVLLLPAVQPSQIGLVHVIPFIVTFVNMSIFQIHKVPYITSLFYYFGYIIPLSIKFTDIYIIQICKVP
jgi:hypothetical protein